MLISIENRFAFLAVPKTASTSIETALEPHCDIVFRKNPQIKHMTLRRFHRHMRPYLAAIGHEELEVCAVIREPIEWLGSWYRYRSRAEAASSSNSTRDMSFEDFAIAYMQDPKPKFATVGQQSIFLAQPNQRLPVTLFQFEEMKRIEAYLSDIFHQKFSFQTLNTSPAGKLDLTHATREALEKYFETDYEIWKQAKKN